MQSNAYIDGFLQRVPTANKTLYHQRANNTAQRFQEYSATEIIGCWGHDVPEGKLTSIPMAVQRESDETVVLSWMTWPSREIRDAGMKASMDDPRCPKDMPFDGKHVIFGGFRVLMHA